MNPDLESLRQLEDADREIARLRAEVAALPGRVAVIEEQLAASRAQVESAQAALKAGDATRRRLEGEIKAQEEKVSKYREQSLAVKTNDQYKALMHEIEFAQAAIRKCEDQILETMVGAEEQQRLLREAEAELKRETAEIEKEKEEARRVTARDEAQLAEWNQRRDALRAAISADALFHYDRVRKLRGSALAEAIEQKCSACNVLLRPQKYNEIRTNEQIMPCDTCGRILWHDPSRTAVESGGRSKGPGRSPHTEKAWYFLPDWNGRRVFIALVNKFGSCSLRVWDAESRQLVHHPQNTPNAIFQEAYADLIAGGIPVSLEHPPNLEEECDPALPAQVLDELRAQVPVETKP